MKYAGMDALELMQTALKPEGAVERICELTRRTDLPILGATFGAKGG